MSLHTMTTTLQTIEHETGPAPTASIVMLHGLGADGSDFAPFVQEVALPALPGGVRWVFPNAPHIPVSMNGGYVMPAWYDIRQDRRDEDAPGLMRSAAQIEALLLREIARGVPAERIVLAGFSQGCAMSLLAGLRFGQRLAGVVGLSGYLPLAADYAARKAAGEFAQNAATPVWLAHGSQDEMVPVARGAESRDALAALGHDVSWQTYPMAHSVCMPEVADLTAWLRDRLK